MNATFAKPKTYAEWQEKIKETLEKVWLEL